MHFAVIAAFALVLSARTSVRSWWLFESVRWTYVVVGGQTLLAVGLAAISTLLVIRCLRRNPSDADPAQNLFARSAMVVRTLLLISLGVDVLLTPWMSVVREHWGLGKIVAIDDLVAMMPFFLGVILCWVAQYPADLAIRNLTPVHSSDQDDSHRKGWRLGEYVLFNIRHQLLLIVVPMGGILIAYDLSAKYSRQLHLWTHLVYAEQVALMIAAGLMFLISPVVLRHVWSTRALPSDGLRGRLERTCGRIRLRYREILIWQSDGVVVNAAVMGLIPTFRYILLSDGLLDTMKDEQIEAVFGHEAGHVKHLHIHFYMLFAGLSMLIVGGLLLLVWKFMPYSDAKQWVSLSRVEWNNALDLVAMGLVLLCWIFGFGWVSRRFERQADVFGVRCVGSDMETCDRPDCRIHHSASAEKADGKALCPAAADVFAGALHRIAILNGIVPAARSWRHSSIASRMAFVRELARDPKALRRFNRIVVATKAVLFMGTAIGCVVGAHVYWPHGFIRYWFGW